VAASSVSSTFDSPTTLGLTSEFMVWAGERAKAYFDKQGRVVVVIRRGLGERPEFQACPTDVWVDYTVAWIEEADEPQLATELFVRCGE
jgi:hypothetical protein